MAHCRLEAPFSLRMFRRQATAPVFASRQRKLASGTECVDATIIPSGRGPRAISSLVVKLGTPPLRPKLAACGNVVSYNYLLSPALLNRVSTPIRNHERGVTHADWLLPYRRQAACRPVRKDSHLVVAAIAIRAAEVSPVVSGGMRCRGIGAGSRSTWLAGSWRLSGNGSRLWRSGRGRLSRLCLLLRAMLLQGR